MNDLSMAEKLVKEEYARAVSLNKKFNSPHEGLAVIEDQFEDLKKEVFKPYFTREQGKMQSQAVQVAAMAIRFIVDCTMQKRDNRIIVNPTEGHGELYKVWDKGEL
jgi:hypothetical protein